MSDDNPEKKPAKANLLDQIQAGKKLKKSGSTANKPPVGSGGDLKAKMDKLRAAVEGEDDVDSDSDLDDDFGPDAVEMPKNKTPEKSVQKPPETKQTAEEKKAAHQAVLQAKAKADAKQKALFKQVSAAAARQAAEEAAGDDWEEELEDKPDLKPVAAPELSVNSPKKLSKEKGEALKGFFEQRVGAVDKSQSSNKPGKLDMSKRSQGLEKLGSKQVASKAEPAPSVTAFPPPPPPGPPLDSSTVENSSAEAEREAINAEADKLQEIFSEIGSRQDLTESERFNQIEEAISNLSHEVPAAKKKKKRQSKVAVIETPVEASLEPRVPLPMLREAILAKANIPVPKSEVCLAALKKIIGNDADKDEAVEKLQENLRGISASSNKLSHKSKELLRVHSSEMSHILLYAQYLMESENAKDHEKVTNYKELYLRSQEELKKKLGDASFSALINDCMKSSVDETHQHFGILFHASSYCEPEFQHIADITNTVNLTTLAGMPEVPEKIKTSPNLFGGEREFVVTPLESGLGQIVLPADPKQDNTVYVVCPDLGKLSENPGQILAQLERDGGQAVFNEIQKAIQDLNLPEGWKADIKFVGENKGAKIAERYFTEIQKGLSNQLAAVPENLRPEDIKKEAIKFVQEKAEGIVEQVGLGEGVKMLGALGGLQALAQHIGSLNFQNVQTSPLLDPQFRSAHPAYDQFLTNAHIPQSIGLAGLVLNESKNLGLTGLIKDADKNLQQYHQYRVIRPALAFVAKNVIPTLGLVMAGAAIGSSIPLIGTGIGALIGGGVAVCKLIFSGFSLWKKKKQEGLKVAAAEQGIEMKSSCESPLLNVAPSVRFSTAVPASQQGPKAPKLDEAQQGQKVKKPPQPT